MVSDLSKDGSQIMSGGEHAWDLISDSDQAIATGFIFSRLEITGTEILKLENF
jgi:hypothetical protein